MMPRLKYRRFGSVMTILAVAACGGGSRPTPAPAPARAPAPQQASPSAATQQFDQVKLYQQMGLLARGAPMPFVGNVSFLATESADSTNVIVAVAISNAALTFARENDRFRAGYTVNIV